MKLPTLYARSSTGAQLQWEIEIEDNKFRSISGQIDGQLTTSNWTVCAGKNLGKANATSPEQQAQKEAEALWKKKKDSGYFESLSEIDSEIFTEPMLAKNYEDYKDKLFFPIFSQPKLDGIRCVVKKTGMWSRNGKEIKSAPHIYQILSQLFTENPDLILDGELYCDKLFNNFNKICSLVKKTKPTNEDIKESESTIQYWIYDIVDPKLTFLERNKKVNEIITKLNNSSIKYVETEKVDSLSTLDSLYEKYVQDGFEGQMVRLNKVYENKRSKSLLKRKEFQDQEFIILDIIEGKGNKTGMAGAFLFKNAQGIEFNSNIKGDFEYLKEIWNNKTKYIGKQATVKYFNLTPEDQVPRFPYVIAIDRASYE